jgi:hypothetical protein
MTIYMPNWIDNETIRWCLDGDVANRWLDSRTSGTDGLITRLVTEGVVVGEFMDNYMILPARGYQLTVDETKWWGHQMAGDTWPMNWLALY